MALVFNPIEAVCLPARSHSPRHEYRVAFGSEKWSATNTVYCIKVQVMENGKVFGRQAPSYTNPDENQLVLEAVKRLHEKYKHKLGSTCLKTKLQEQLEPYHHCEGCVTYTGNGEVCLADLVPLSTIAEEALEYVSEGDTIKINERLIREMGLTCQNCGSELGLHSEVAEDEMRMSDPDEE